MANYKEEVLGRYAVVQFLVDLDGEETLRPFLGRVTQVKTKLCEKSGALATEHFVIFDDGDERWLDLQRVERMNHLQWVNVSKAMPLAKRAKKKEDTRADSGDKNSRTAYLDSSQLANGANADTASVEASGRRVCKRTVSKPRVTQQCKKSGDAATKSSPSAAKTILCNSFSGSAQAGVQDASWENKTKEYGEDESAGAAAMDDRANTGNHLKASHKEEPEEEDAWLEDFQIWMQTVPHGTSKKVSSAENVKAVMRRVRELVAGQGLACPNWPKDAKPLFENVKVNMSHDFYAMRQEAKQMENILGKDQSHGYTMRHPLQKLHLYKMHLGKMSLMKKNGKFIP